MQAGGQRLPRRQLRAADEQGNDAQAAAEGGFEFESYPVVVVAQPGAACRAEPGVADQDEDIRAGSDRPGDLEDASSLADL